MFPRIDPKMMVKITVNVESYYDHWVVLLSYFKTEDKGPGAAGMLPAMVLITDMGARFELENHERMLLGMSPVRARAGQSGVFLSVLFFYRFLFLLFLSICFLPVSDIQNFIKLFFLSVYFSYWAYLF